MTPGSPLVPNFEKKTSASGTSGSITVSQNTENKFDMEGYQDYKTKFELKTSEITPQEELRKKLRSLPTFFQR